MLSEQQAYRTNSLVDFAGGWNQYLAGKSHKARHEMRRVLRRVFDGGDVEYIRHRPNPAREGDGDPRWDLFAMCQQVALASWQATSTTGNTLTHERVRHFLARCPCHRRSQRHGRRQSAAGRRAAGGVCLQLSLSRPADRAASWLRCVAEQSVRAGRGSARRSCCVRSRTASRGATCRSILGPGETLFKRRLRTAFGSELPDDLRAARFLAVAGGAAFAVGQAALAAGGRGSWQGGLGLNADGIRAAVSAAASRFALVGGAPKGPLSRFFRRPPRRVPSPHFCRRSALAFRRPACTQCACCSRRP